MSQLIVMFVIFGMTLGCHLRPDKTEYGTRGIGPSKLLGSVKSPLAVFCSRVSGDKAVDQIDLSLYRQMDGTYTAFVRSPFKNGKKPSPVIFEAIPNLRVEKKLFQTYKYEIPFDRFLGTHTARKFEVLFFPPSLFGKETSSRVTPSPWQKEKATEYLICSSRADIVPKSPQVGTDLTVIGSIYDANLKIQRQVTHKITVDFLTKTEGADLILSLSNQIPKDSMPLNAPVLDQCGALVGFTKSYNPENLFATTVYNIHDEKIRTALDKDIVLFSALSPPPMDPVPSERLIQALCTRVVISNGHDPMVGFPSLGKIIASHCFEGSILQQ